MRRLAATIADHHVPTVWAPFVDPAQVPAERDAEQRADEHEERAHKIISLYAVHLLEPTGHRDRRLKVAGAHSGTDARKTRGVVVQDRVEAGGAAAAALRPVHRGISPAEYLGQCRAAPH